VNMKYAAQNPANSILVCEEWSGLRAAPRPADGSVAPQGGDASIPSTNGAALANGTPLANSNGVRHEAQDSTLTQSS